MIYTGYVIVTPRKSQTDWGKWKVIEDIDVRTLGISHLNCFMTQSHETVMNIGKYLLEIRLPQNLAKVDLVICDLCAI